MHILGLNRMEWLVAWQGPVGFLFPGAATKQHPGVCVSNPGVHELLPVNPYSVLEWINTQNFLWEQSHSCLVAQGWSGGHSRLIRVRSSDIFSVV